MRIVETGDDSPPFHVDPLCIIIGNAEKLLTACGCYAFIRYGNGRDLRLSLVEGSDFSIVQNHFRCVHID